MLPVRKSQNWLPSLFSDFFGNEWLDNVNSTTPAVNIIENDDEFNVEVAVPGLSKDDFKVRVDDNDRLHISFEKRVENSEKDKKGNYLRREFSYSNFQRTMLLPDNVNKDEVSAKVEDGVLSIVIPKKKEEKEAKKERLIEVK